MWSSPSLCARPRSTWVFPTSCIISFWRESQKSCLQPMSPRWISYTRWTEAPPVAWKHNMRAPPKTIGPTLCWSSGVRPIGFFSPLTSITWYSAGTTTMRVFLMCGGLLGFSFSYGAQREGLDLRGGGMPIFASLQGVQSLPFHLLLGDEVPFSPPRQQRVRISRVVFVSCPNRGVARAPSTLLTAGVRNLNDDPQKP